MQATKPHIHWNPDGQSAVVTQRSPFTGESHTRVINMTPKAYLLWREKRVLIQNALPHLTPGEREFLMTGITDEEWDNEFKRSDD